MPKKLITVSIDAPGFLGLNSQQAGLIEDGWASQADNCVFDDGGRIASRKGTKHNHAVAGPPPVICFEYIDKSAAILEVFTTATQIWKVVGTTATDISGSITTPTAGNWKFQNFNGALIGFQADHAPIILTTVGGTFTDLTMSGTDQPTTAVNECLAAFGRLWVLDGTNLKYSDSLTIAPVAWSGLFDLTTVMLGGVDVPVALREFNGFLIIFCKNTTIVYNNPWVPTGTGGFDATTMSLVENIDGVGAISRDVVQVTDDDIIFLSHTGVRSLGRTIQEKSMPTSDISKNNRSMVHALLAADSTGLVKSGYSPTLGLYLLTFPSATPSTTVGKVVCFDLRVRLPDGSARTTVWSVNHTCYSSSLDGTLRVGTTDGFLSSYEGYRDGRLYDDTGGSPYLLHYHSSWSQLNEDFTNHLKIPKHMGVILTGAHGQTINLITGYDYDPDKNHSILRVLEGNISAEFGVGEFGIAEFIRSNSITNTHSNPYHTGVVFRIGLKTEIDGEQLSIQRFIFQAKIGRETV